jgi:AcrR family transcriptional regulator
MSPRPYQLGQRKGLIDEGRQRVIDAARALLAEADSYTDFTINAVATRADVARATIYYQFESKTGLLEALCDALGDAAQMSELATVFTNPDPVKALRGFISRFGTFWGVDRTAMRRLRALAALDPEVGAVISARDVRRRSGLLVLVGRLSEHHLITVESDRAVDLLFTLTSFETFDSLAAPGKSTEDVVPTIVWVATTLLLHQPASNR